VLERVAQGHQSTSELIPFERARLHTGLWCVVEGGGGITGHEAGIAQGADQYDECVHMYVFNPADSATASSPTATGYSI